MRTSLRLAAALTVGGLLASASWAQNPAPPAPSPPRPAPRPAPAPARPQGPHSRTAYRPTQYQVPPSYHGSPGYEYHPGYRSVLRSHPRVAPEYTYGFRNPGGVGRYEEFYPPGDRFQSGGRDPVTAAGFDRNIPTGSLAEQAMAQQVGTQRYQAFQQHLDNYARPFGWGWGWGYGLGFF